MSYIIRTSKPVPAMIWPHDTEEAAIEHAKALCDEYGVDASVGKEIVSFVYEVVERRAPQVSGK